MNREEILAKVKPYIEEAKAGVKTEDEKVDLKAKWYNLKEIENKSEFLKDITSIANTLGRDGFIIIGIDEKGKTFHDSKIIDSGLDDESKIQDLIIKNIEGGLDFSVVEISYDGHLISVIHIPPSIKMPHVIKHYETKKGKQEEQKIFVRKGTKILPATKYDLDKIYLYKGQVRPEYDISIYYPEKSFSFYIDSGRLMLIFTSLVIKNNGYNSLISYRMFLNTCFQNYGSKITGMQALEYKDKNIQVEIMSKPIVIQPLNHSIIRYFRFYSPLKYISSDFQDVLKGVNIMNHKVDKVHNMYSDFESNFQFEIDLITGEKLTIKPKKIDKLYNNYSQTQVL